jgi:hypothetical protein
VSTGLVLALKLQETKIVPSALNVLKVETVQGVNCVLMVFLEILMAKMVLLDLVKNATVTEMLIQMQLATVTEKLVNV